MSQRPRHRYAADFPCDLPERQLNIAPGVPDASVNAGTHRARPKSARLESVSRLKDVTTPVPRVLLSITLAGPTPSGSADMSRLCQGCSHPHRHHPAGLPSATSTCCDKQTAAVSHLHSNNNASRRKQTT